MQYRLPGIMLAAAVALGLSACADTANYNMNANANRANANANLNSNMANANANMNTNNDISRRAPTREEYDRERARYEREARDSGRTIGTGVNDGWLWVKTRFELAAAEDLRDSTINVDVENDVVTLTGTVATAAQKSRAEAVSKGIEGVKSVRNQLRVAPDATNANT